MRPSCAMNNAAAARPLAVPSWLTFHLMEDWVVALVDGVPSVHVSCSAQSFSSWPGRELPDLLMYIRSHHTGG